MSRKRSNTGLDGLEDHISIDSDLISSVLSKKTVLDQENYQVNVFSDSFLLNPNNKEQIGKYLTGQSTSIVELTNNEPLKGSSSAALIGGGDGVYKKKAFKTPFPFSTADKEVIEAVSKDFKTDLDEAREEIKQINTEMSEKTDAAADEIRRDEEETHEDRYDPESIDDITARLIMEKCSGSFPRILQYPKNVFIDKDVDKDYKKECTNNIKMLTTIVFGDVSPILCAFVTNSLGFEMNNSVKSKLSRAMEQKLLIRFDKKKNVVITNKDYEVTEINSSIKQKSSEANLQVSLTTVQSPKTEELSQESSMTSIDTNKSIKSHKELTLDTTEVADDGGAPPLECGQQNDTKTEITITEQEGLEEITLSDESIKIELNNQYNRENQEFKSNFPEGTDSNVSMESRTAIVDSNTFVQNRDDDSTLESHLDQESNKNVGVSSTEVLTSLSPTKSIQDKNKPSDDPKEYKSLAVSLKAYDNNEIPPKEASPSVSDKTPVQESLGATKESMKSSAEPRSSSNKTRL
uniref:Uncharacterized protein n=1 Tax=Schizaphis graminum TaxID=13262 RepID=A0A2S2NTM5_SCHGA